MAKVNLKIEGFPYQVEDGITIMEAAKQCGYEIPSLCSFNHGECSSGSCRAAWRSSDSARTGWPSSRLRSARRYQKSAGICKERTCPS